MTLTNTSPTGLPLSGLKSTYSKNDPLAFVRSKNLNVGFHKMQRRAFGQPSNFRCGPVKYPNAAAYESVLRQRSLYQMSISEMADLICKVSLLSPLAQEQIRVQQAAEMERWEMWKKWHRFWRLRQATQRFMRIILGGERG